MADIPTKNDLFEWLGEDQQDKERRTMQREITLALGLLSNHDDLMIEAIADFVETLTNAEAPRAKPSISILRCLFERRCRSERARQNHNTRKSALRFLSRPSRTFHPATECHDTIEDATAERMKKVLDRKILDNDDYVTLFAIFILGESEDQAIERRNTTCCIRCLQRKYPEDFEQLERIHAGCAMRA